MAVTAQDHPTDLPLKVQLFYAVGQLGWSTLINIIGLQLVYFYLPPAGSGLPIFISQASFLLVLNVIAILSASGRLIDAITDPLFASWSDRSTNPRGRRIPFMKWGALPAALFCVLMFVPPVAGESGWNITWLFFLQALFYIALTAYVTPFFALLPELGKTAGQRLNLSTWISITYALGIILAGLTPNIAGVFAGFGLSRVQALQAAFTAAAVLALLCMLVPVWTIDERRYARRSPSSVPMMAAIRQTFGNPHFRFYVVADFAYFMGLTIINTGLLYYVTVLLGLGEGMVSVLLPLLVLVSFVFYPVVNVLARRWQKKGLVVIAFLAMSVIFLAIYFLGRLPVDPAAQAYAVILTYAVPLAFLGILPNAILADIAHHDSLKTGEPKEGMYFAARTLMQKFGQTFGILIFAMLTTFGKDPGHDLGIRLSGVFGCLLCLAAGLIFTRYDEQQLLGETEQLAPTAAD